MRRGGFTLLEGLLAAAILATAAVALLEALRAGVKQTERVEGEVLAVALAQEAMEVVSSLPYARLAEAARGALTLGRIAELASDPDLAPVRRRLKQLAEPAGQEVSVTLGPVTGPPGTGRLVEVTVEVRFEDELSPGKRVTRRVVLRRLVTDDGEVDA